MRVTGTGLAPADDHAGDELARHPIGSEVEVTLFRAPNPAYRRLLYAVVGDVYPNTDWPTSDAMMVFLKTQLRHVDSWLTMGGGVTVNPRSLSTFDHDEMIEFGMASMGLISTQIVPGLDIDGLLKAKQSRIRGSFR